MNGRLNMEPAALCRRQSDARAYRPQQECGQVRMIRGLGILALRAMRLGTADRRYVRSVRRCLGLRLISAMTAATLGGTFAGRTLVAVTLASRTFVGGAFTGRTFVRGAFAGMALAALALTTLAAA